MLPRVLIATANTDHRDRLGGWLEETSLPAVAAHEQEVWKRLSEEPFDLMLIEDSMLPEDPGLLVDIRQLPDHPEVAVFGTGVSDRRTAELQAAGALAVFEIELDDSFLIGTLSALVERCRKRGVSRDGHFAYAAAPALSGLTTKSQAMREVLRLALKVVSANTSLLILGETGTGKEWLAKAIHGDSPRADGQFIAVNCAAVPEGLLESEIFGHEKGAFTGAVRARRGCFELAHQGTLFLDEIGDMSVHLQAKLLRALQEGQVQRVGSETQVKVDARIIAATNQDLGKAMAEGRFRRDLYYRLNVMTLTMPPLRVRRADIPDLAEDLLQRFREQLGRLEVRRLSREVVDSLVKYDWPGNVRELINVIERAVLLCETDSIELRDLPEAIERGGGDAEPGVQLPTASLFSMPLPEARSRVLAEFDRDYLGRLLAENQGRIAKTARAAAISERALYSRMRELGLTKEAYK